MSNEKALKLYNVKKYRTPDGYTSDIAIFTIPSNEKIKTHMLDIKILLIQRSVTDSEGRPNIEAGKWALPGGFVNPDETAFECAKRELTEETSVEISHLEHFGVYDQPGRDPRGWIISNAHLALVPENKLTKRRANDDASDAQLFSINEVFKMDIAFDHAQIINDGLNVIKSKFIEMGNSKDLPLA
ncbi:NUDIX hydrolase [Paenibacillus sp. FSL K6-2862]|uniref:NUDIX hydrolase n=1 Tax=Paenibacillus sp. FSL K6-2862 TaxID=2921484 RepID=UPI0030F780F7